MARIWNTMITAETRNYMYEIKILSHPVEHRLLIGLSCLLMYMTGAILEIGLRLGVIPLNVTP